jgi:hypothetical protein
MSFAILFLSLILACANSTSLSSLFKQSGLEKEGNTLMKAFRTVNQMNEKFQLGDMTLECALCGIAMNELEGISFFLRRALSYRLVNREHNDH